MVTHLLKDKNNPNKVAGAVGFNVRTGDYHVFSFYKIVIVMQQQLVRCFPYL